MNNLYEDYIIHYGVKGQKWGVRRYQNEDRSLTNLGKKRYEPTKEDVQNAKKEFRKAVVSFNKSAIAKAELKKQRAITSFKDSKIREKLSKLGNRQSKRQQKLTEKYKSEGMSESDARVAAYKRERAEKLLVVAGVVTLAAIAVHQSNKHKVDLDTIVPKGTTMQHITLNKDKGVSDAFYVSYTKKDKKMYEGMYGGYQLQTSGKHDIHVMTTQTNKNVKIAGINAGKAAAQHLIDTDPEYADTLKKALFNKHMRSSLKMPGYKNARNAAMGKGKLNRNGYLAINTALNDHSKDGESAAKRLQAELRKRGYGGMVDTNDMYISGYKAQHPLILINGKNDLTNRQVRTVSAADARKKSYRYIATISGIPIATFVAKSVAQGKAQKAVTDRIKARVSENHLIAEYKKAHPKTNLTDKQILEIEMRR